MEVRTAARCAGNSERFHDDRHDNAFIDFCRRAISAPQPAWLEQVVCHDDPELSLTGDTSEMSQKPQLRIRLSTDTVVAMSVAGTIAAVIAALLAMIVHAPPSPFVATQPPAEIEASSI